MSVKQSLVHLKAENITQGEAVVLVTSYVSVDPLSGHSIVDFEARCGDLAPIRSRMTVAGHDHPLAPGYDLSQLRKDHAAHSLFVAGLAESRQRAGELLAKMASEQALGTPEVDAKTAEATTA